MNTIINEIKKHITKDNKYQININDNLFEAGYLDSMGILEVISIIEKKSGKEFDPEVFIADNFKTLKDIENLINTEIND